MRVTLAPFPGFSNTVEESIRVVKFPILQMKNHRSERFLNKVFADIERPDCELTYTEEQD